MRRQPSLKRQLVLLTDSKRKGQAMPHRATRESTRIGQEAEGVKGERGQKPFKWFPQKETGEAECAGLGLASFNNCRTLEHRRCPWLSDTWLWGDPGRRTMGGPECARPIEEVAGVWAPDWLVCI